MMRYVTDQKAFANQQSNQFEFLEILNRVNAPTVLQTFGLNNGVTPLPGSKCVLVDTSELTNCLYAEFVIQALALILSQKADIVD
jgi:hypothetical protein